MKKNRLFKFLGVIGLSLLTCSCALSQPKVLAEEQLIVKRSYNPMDNGENVENLDLRNIYFYHNEYGDIANANYMQYYEYYTYSNQNDSDDLFFYVSLNSNNDLTLNIITDDIQSTTFNAKAFILPVYDWLADYINSRIYIDFDLNYNVETISMGTFDSNVSIWNNVEFNHFNSYGYNYFVDYTFNQEKNGYLKGTSVIEYANETHSYLYIVFDEVLSLSIPSGDNQLTFPLGKMHIYSEQFPHNDTYTLDSSNSYQNGYDVGYSNGLNKGEAVGEQNALQQYQGLTYQQIYSNGYRKGYDDRGTSKLPALFGAIVNIPISVLNGLVPLSYFDISIMRVVITIMALNIILYVISYVMSAKG